MYKVSKAFGRPVLPSCRASVEDKFVCETYLSGMCSSWY